jgi:alcohol dehydrogenase
MKAVKYEAFGERPTVCVVADPVPGPDDVVLRVEATGICRSDWHGWMGHDADISLPHVPGHEIAGVIVACGSNVSRWKQGDRVTLPFVCGCGVCPQCQSGNEQVCDHQFQPGFTHWGSFAEFVRIKYADSNLVALPDEIDFVAAASLGCRFVTSWRAVLAQGRVARGEWVAVYGCGGVGLSAVMIANAHGARVIGIDINPDALAVAKECGAGVVIEAGSDSETVAAVRDASDGGVQLSIDALGSSRTCLQSILSLAKRGRHVQIGLMVENEGRASIPMCQVLANELEIIGSHGMQAHCYGPMLEMIVSGRLDPELLVERSVDLETGIDVLTKMDQNNTAGITVINRF